MCTECRSYMGHHPQCPNSTEEIEICIDCEHEIEDINAAEETGKGLICEDCSIKRSLEEEEIGVL